MKRLISWLLLSALMLGLSACAVETTEAPELLEPVVINSDMATAEIGNVYDGTVLEGSVLPEVQDVYFDTSGKVGEVCVVLGDRVKTGDPLVRLDTAALEARRDNLAAQLEHAKTMHWYGNREAELTRQLLAAQYGVESARCKLYINEQNQAAQSRNEQIASLTAELQEAEADLNLQSVITAPCDGTVVAVHVRVGDSVRPEATVVKVTDDTTCYLQTEFMTEYDAAEASELYATIGGVRYEVEYVPIESSEYITQVLSGAVMHSTFLLKDAASDLVGQYALLYRMTAQREQVLYVPANAVLRDAEGRYVYVEENGVKTRRPVEVGLMTVAQVEILSGLEEGERVYVVG